MRRHRRVRDHDVPSRERWRHLPNHIEKRVVVRNKDLNVIAHLGELGWRADKVRHRPWVTVPNKNVESLPAQIIRDAASDDAESDYANVLSGSTRHWGCAAIFQLWPLFSLRRKRPSRNPEV